jgi:hypothetical protein
MDRRCEAITRSGERCKNKAILGSTRCQVAAHNVASASGHGKPKTIKVLIPIRKPMLDSSTISPVTESEVWREITPSPVTSTMPVEESSSDTVAYAHNDQTWTAFISQPRIKFADKVSIHKPASITATTDEDDATTDEDDATTDDDDATTDDGEISLAQSVHSNINANEVYAHDIKTVRDALNVQAQKMDEMNKTHHALMEMVEKLEKKHNGDKGQSGGRVPEDAELVDCVMAD